VDGDRLPHAPEWMPKAMAIPRDEPSPAISHRDLMLATPGKLFSAKGWIFELKRDGFRCLIIKRGDSVRLESRSGRDMSPVLPRARRRTALQRARTPDVYVLKADAQQRLHRAVGCILKRAAACLAHDYSSAVDRGVLNTVTASGGYSRVGCLSR
jgi:hypothetical protein